MFARKIISVMLALIMVFTLFVTLNFIAETHVTAAVSTEDAIFLGSAGGQQRIAAVVMPLAFTEANGSTLPDTSYFKLTFKCKMLSGTKPMIGMLRTDTATSGAHCVISSVDNVATSGIKKTVYDSSTGMFTAYFSHSYCGNQYYRNGRWGYLTIGNAEHNNSWHDTDSYNYNDSFIMSDPQLYICDSSYNPSGDNLIPDFSGDNCSFNGTYFLRENGNTNWDNFYRASAGKWSIDSSPALIKRVKVPVDYNTSANYNVSNFVRTADTATTREYYTNTNYPDTLFSILKGSNNAGFEIITDINKKMIIIDANHENEADNNNGSGNEYAPARNKPANIFLPISYGQYSMNVGNTTNINYIVKVSMRAVRLEGDGYPVLGRIVGKKENDGYGSQALPTMCHNINIGDYYSNHQSSHEKYYDSGNNLLEYSYNENTGDFVGYMRVRASDNTYATYWGCNEVITIGNSEHVWADGGKFDTTEFNTSFAISNIKVDVYSCSGAAPYTMGSLVAEDVAPGLYAENIDDTSNWAYQFVGTRSNHSRDCIRASQYLWQVDGCTGMVHSENLTLCMNNNHSITHWTATDETCEYWGCSGCHKCYSDPYCKNEITSDLYSKRQMIVVDSLGNRTAAAFLPIKLTGFTGTKYFKFSCKVKCFGDETPVVSTFYADYNGTNVTECTAPGFNDGDMAIMEYSYDASTQTLSGLLRGWIATNYNRSTRYPYRRYNPVSGANAAIVIGNCKFTDNGYENVKKYTGFAFTEPELYALNGNTLNSETIGDNLITPITDKTVDFGSVWSTDFSSDNNPMSAPCNRWYRVGNSDSYLSVSDVPEGYFDGTAAPKVLRLAGAKNASVVAISRETFLESNTMYQFDMDYRIFGGTEQRFNIADATSNGYSLVQRQDVTDDGSHLSFRFTTRNGLRTSGNGNFRIQLGVDYDTKRITTSAYFTNISVRKVNGSTLGPNHYINGDFSMGEACKLNDVPSDTIQEYLPHWDNVANTITYSSAILFPYPENELFNESEAKGASDVAVKFLGGNHSNLEFKVELEPDTYYQLQYDYRCVGDMPIVSASTNTEGTVQITKQYDCLETRYRASYQLYSDSLNTHTQNIYGNPNTRIRFALGGASQGNEFYINGVTLYKLSGAEGNPVSSNIIGELNPLFDDTAYSAIIPNVAPESDSSYPIIMDQSGENSISRCYAPGWFGYNASGDYSTVNAYIIRVPSNFFDRKSFSTRISDLENIILGTLQHDGINPDYDPDGDGVFGTVNDLNHMTLKKLYSEGEIDGGAALIAQDRLDTVIMTNRTSSWSGGGTSYYVSNAGNDYNSGKSDSAAFATITKANNKAVAGDTVYLRRGDKWRNNSQDQDQCFTLKAGVHYVAYGSGPKPELIGSRKNYASSSLWTQYSTNIWKCTYATGTLHTSDYAGMIYFIDSSGNVIPGINVATPNSNTSYTWSMNDVNSDLKFYAPYKNETGKGSIFVYSTTNPGSRFSQIEIGLARPVVNAKSGTSSSFRYNTRMANIAVKYGGGHGIKANGASNIRVEECEVAYIGGIKQVINGNANRMGNGIEFGMGAANIHVQDCYVHDCFDAGVTYQSYGSESAVTFDNVYFEGNVIERCNMNIEIFMRNAIDTMQNIYIRNNILRNAGYGWGSLNRANDSVLRGANLKVSKNTYYSNTSNLNITNNIFDCTKYTHVLWTWDSDGPLHHVGVNASGNTFIQKAGAEDYRIMAYGPIGGSYQYAGGRQALIEAVEKFDTSPADVFWLDNNK
ncbi:MAG: hypothetical protein J5659_04565 [Clostridia bacterium]|nr:hypothetical protein [Clostridia bacterium]